MNPLVTRYTVPIHDPPAPRGRRRRIYLKSLEVEVLPLDPGKMEALLNLIFPETGSDDFSTNTDENV